MGSIDEAWFRRGSRGVVSAFVVALSACSSGADAPPTEPGSDAGTDAVPAASSDGAPAVGAAPADGLAPLQIQVDYRYDKSGFFSDPSRRAALEAACAIWSRTLRVDFPDVPAGTSVLSRDPESPTVAGTTFPIDYTIHDLVVFVGSSRLPEGTLGSSAPTAGLSGVTDPKLRGELSARFDGGSFRPWTGWISFDADAPFFFDPAPRADGSVPAGQVDFVSVALHELGHVLGFGTAKAFEARVEGGAFVGPRAKALFGGAVPLAGDLNHFPNTLLWERQRALMDVSDPPGARFFPTALDVAVLEDLGYAAAR